MNRLLVLCARDGLNRDRAESIKELLLHEKIDWNLLTKTSVMEGVAPLLYRNLNRFSDFVPVSALANLKNLYFRNTARNVYLFQNTKGVFNEIAVRGVKAVPIKGFRLAMDLYSDLGLRTFVDVDLIVAQRDRALLVEILERNGYFKEKRKNSDQANGENEEFYWTYRPNYIKDRAWIELHVNIPGLHYPLDSRHILWQETGPVEKEGIAISCLSFEHELCILCLHAQEHSYSRLDWMTDIAEIVTRIPLDWEKVIGFCDREKIHSSVFYALHLVNSFWPNSIPVRVLARFDVAWWEQKVMHFLWPEERVRSRTLDFVLPMHVPTVFPLLRKKDYFQFFKVTFRLFFPPPHWVSYYYGLPKNSLRMIFHYLWRIFYPFLFLSRKALKTG